jgi:hypothetical protein
MFNFIWRINMRTFKKSLLMGVMVFIVTGATGVQAHDRDRGWFAQLQGAWMSQVSIRDCTSGNVIAGPFSGLITFHEDGTISEMGPALPNSTRSPGHGSWYALGHSTFSERLVFLRFDLAGVFLGTQVITAKPVVAKDSMSYSAQGGSFEVKDRLGVTIATGCSSATGIRFM